MIQHNAQAEHTSETSVRLVNPSVEYADSVMEAAREFAKENSQELSQALSLQFEQFVAGQLEQADPSKLNPDYVPATELWIVHGHQFIGRISIRHYLNDALRRVGGHIGYAVRPTARKRGYATQALKMALSEARKLGLHEVMLTCDDNNIGSIKVIESAGGILVDRNTHDHVPKRYYRIKLG